MRRLLFLLASLALAQVYHPTATLIHGDTEVVVEKTSPDELGLAWIEENDEGVLFIFYDPPPYRVRVRFGENAEAFAALALVDQPDEGGGAVVLAGGEARYLEAEDRVDYEIRAEPDAVEVKKGRFRAFGRRLDYDNEAGLARIQGPVRFVRGGDTPLEGEAETLLYKLEGDELWLLGGVRVVQGERTTTAARALVVEEEATAYLFGNPVESRAPGEALSGKQVRYDLNTGEIWVLEAIEGRFSD